MLPYLFKDTYDNTKRRFIKNIEAKVGISEDAAKLITHLFLVQQVHLNESSPSQNCTISNYDYLFELCKQIEPKVDTEMKLITEMYSRLGYIPKKYTVVFNVPQGVHPSCSVIRWGGQQR